jgi:hypothetical protein
MVLTKDDLAAVKAAARKGALEGATEALKAHSADTGTTPGNTALALDEWGSIALPQYPGWRFFAPFLIASAMTRQQVGNIMVQCGVDQTGALVPAGPQHFGWWDGQKIHSLYWPLQRDTGDVPIFGGVKWEAADGFEDQEPKYLFLRLRTRCTSMADLESALKGHVPGFSE